MDADVIVVGGGVVGLWTAYHLNAKGVKSILFEQFPYPHTRGSSHGQSRITRTSYIDKEYASLMPEAHRRWRELEKQSGRKLLIDTGLVTLWDARQSMNEFNCMLSNLKKLGVSHEILSGKDLAKRHPGFSEKLQYTGILESDAGLLRADNCTAALRDWYTSHGGELHDSDPVLHLDVINDSRIEVKTSVKTYLCKSVVLTCGPYINSILSTVNLKLPVQTKRILVHYWKDETTSSNYSLANNFPEVILMLKGGETYSLPSYEYPGLMKICYHGGSTVDPKARDSEITYDIDDKNDRVQHLKEIISETFPGIDSSSPAIEEICMYTGTPDSKFILDFHPNHTNVVIGAGFSGHGFKTSPSVGHILANMAVGQKTSYKLEPFSMKRFKNISKL
ncbi:peroxisomal sarcosine oxidase-like isoform X1 [Styela clava]